MGVCSPIRYTLIMQLVKIKLLAPLEGRKIQLKVEAMDTERKVDVVASDQIAINQDARSAGAGGGQL